MNIHFLAQINSELQKVVWPKREEVLKLTGQVILVSLLIGGFIGGLDYILTTLNEMLIL